MAQSNELRVFISSTFRDLQEEREHLVKKIFPEIRALCRGRGITFTEVDLRWGLTQENVVLGQVIRTCLEEIDRCRPYFIGITGERYGYVPELHEYYKDPELLQRWSWIEDAAMDGSSIIDLEFRHGVLNDPEADNGRARFFFRRQRRQLDESNGESEEVRHLDRLKHRVREAGLSFEEYRDPVSLGEMVYDELIEIIKRDFAEAKPPTPIEDQRSKHRAFASSRVRAYIPNPEYLKRLNEWITADEPPLVLYAESGSGKSSLVAFWCELLRRRQPDLFIIEHYVGIGAGDSDHLGIIRHIMQEIKEGFDRSEELPTKPEELERDFANWLGFNAGSPMLLVIDGINQLSGRALDLHWLPPVMPEGVRLVISSTVEQTLVDLRQRGWSELGMQPLKEREREAVVVRFLAEYHKALLSEQVKRIAEDPKCSHPLFLRTLLEELRLHGTHEHLEGTLTKLLSTTGTEDLFQRVLERLEDDYSQKVVREVMSLLWCSRGGLSELELAELTGISRLKLSTLLLGLDYHLVRRDGLLSFFHDYLRRAVGKRYLPEASRRVAGHRLLAGHFEKEEASLRMAQELLWQYEHIGDNTGVVGVLARVELLQLLWRGGEVYEVLGQWSRLVEAGHDPEGVYRESLRRYIEETPRAGHVEALETIGGLLDRLGKWSGAIDAYKQMLAVVAEQGDRVGIARAERSLGGMKVLRGEYEEAMQRLEHARSLFEEFGDRRGLSDAIGNIGKVHADRGETDRALECYQLQLTIAEELGDRGRVGQANGDMGIVYWRCGEYDRALECYQRMLTIAEEMGNRHGVSRANGNMGLVYDARGENDRALECLQRQLSIAEELGDRYNVMQAIGGMAPMYWHLGEYDRALECLQRKLSIAEELGDRSSISNAIGSMGQVYSDRGEYDRALECMQQELSIAEELGERGGVSRANGNMGIVYWRRGEYEQALECYQRQLSIAEELGHRASVSYAIGNMGVVFRDLGEYERALECYQQQKSIAEELGEPRGVSFAIGNMGSVHYDLGEYDRVLECYESALRGHREIDFRYGVTYWLCGRVAMLLECIEQQSMPEYLPNHIAGATIDTWQLLTLRTAREDAEECRVISTDLSKLDTLSIINVLLARLDAVEGDREGAVEQLRAMLAGAGDDEQRAELHYWLWKIAGGDHRTEALQLYRTLAEKTPKQEYGKRIEELTATPPREAINAAE